MLIAVFGLPGSGKSYFATHLAKEIDAVYLSSDQLRKQIKNRPEYTQQEKERVYEVLLEKTLQALEDGKTVVFDATFHKADRRQKVIEFAKEKNSLLYWIEVFADENLIRKRINQNRENSDADYSVYQKIKAEFEPLEKQHLKLRSTNTNLEEMLKRALEYLSYEK